MSTGDRGRRDEILEAALRCFLERGYEATTIQEIRERSGASTGSIYHLFASKDAIAAELLVDTLTSWQTSLVTALDAASGGGAEVMVRTAVCHYVDWIVASPDRARFLFQSPRARLEETERERVHARNRELLRAIKQHVAPHVASGAIRALPQDMLLPIVIGPAMEWARQWLTGRSRTSPAAARKILADAAWAAVRAG
jgi:AcrR family transcriptional regulator